MSVRQVRRAVGGPLTAVVEREFRTAIRNRALLALSFAFAAVVLGIAWNGGAAGYLPLTLDLLAPVEVLVPALAFAYTFRTVLSDRRSGELAMIRTYPLARATYVLGVYLGRAAALLVVVVLSLLVAGLLVSVLGGPSSTVLAAHRGADSVVLYVRFITLTGGFALVALAVGLLVSSLAGTARSALALAVGGLVVLVVGIDLGIVVGLTSGTLGGGVVEWILALSPTSAYRGLVLETVLGVTTTAGVQAANPVASAIGLVLWWVGALALAIRAAWRGR